MKTPTYASLLREEIRDLESADPAAMRKLLNILDNALGELDRVGRELNRVASNASCVANGIQPD